MKSRYIERHFNDASNVLIFCLNEYLPFKFLSKKRHVGFITSNVDLLVNLGGLVGTLSTFMVSVVGLSFLCCFVIIFLTQRPSFSSHLSL